MANYNVSLVPASNYNVSINTNSSFKVVMNNASGNYAEKAKQYMEQAREAASEATEDKEVVEQIKEELVDDVLDAIHDAEAATSAANTAATQATTATTAARTATTAANTAATNANTQATNAAGWVIESREIVYQEGTSATVVPTGTWQATIPSVAQGNFLWSRKTTNYANHERDVEYSVTRNGMDGTGSVRTVMGIPPNEHGDVVICAVNGTTLEIGIE